MEDGNVEPKDADDHDYNGYITAKVKIPVDGYKFATGTVKSRARNEMGELIGKSDPNPLMDSSYYEVEMEDGSLERYSANVIAESIYDSLDDQGYGRRSVIDIVDHRSDDTAVPISRGTTRGEHNRDMPVKTTRGWKLCVEFDDGSTEWVPLRLLKESDPVRTAKYAQKNGLVDEPAFAW